MPTPVDGLLRWLIEMDDTGEAGVAARRDVTLSQIIAVARDVRRWIDVVGAGEPEALGYPAEGAPRLWELDHPYYGADGYDDRVDSFAELRHAIDRMDEDMNFVYRWDWKDYSQPHYDDLYLGDPDEPRAKQELTVHFLMPRKSKFASLTCPITHEQEAEVLEWLRGPRVLGYLRTMWAPLLGAGANGEADRG